MLARSDIVVFLGPSLRRSDAECILDATFLPPAEQGDLLGVVDQLKPRVIALVDGVFLSRPSVWHKEILYALEQGVHVYGSSSMGALRAAELAAYGMRGVGQIFELFASGVFLDDDEVALVHGDAAVGYRALTEPMVNLRATLAHARQQGLIDAAQYSALEQLGKEMFFAERTRRAFLSVAVEHGILADSSALAAFLATQYVDLKRADAVTLLTELSELPAELPPFVAEFELSRNRLFETLHLKDATLWEGETKITRGDVMAYHALHDPDLEQVSFSALNRGLALILAELFGVEVSDEQITLERQRFKRKHRLARDEVFQQWLRDNHIDEPLFNGLMRQKAICRRLQQWLWLKHGRLGSTGLLMEELILTDRYKEMLRRTASRQDLLDRYTPFMIDSEQAGDATIQELLREHVAREGITLDQPYMQWLREANFASRASLELELIKSRAARQAVSQLLHMDEA